MEHEEWVEYLKNLPDGEVGDDPLITGISRFIDHWADRNRAAEIIIEEMHWCAPCGLGAIRVPKNVTNATKALDALNRVLKVFVSYGVRLSSLPRILDVNVPIHWLPDCKFRESLVLAVGLTHRVGEVSVQLDMVRGLMSLAKEWRDQVFLYTDVMDLHVLHYITSGIRVDTNTYSLHTDILPTMYTFIANVLHTLLSTAYDLLKEKAWCDLVQNCITDLPQIIDFEGEIPLSRNIYALWSEIWVAFVRAGMNPNKDFMVMFGYYIRDVTRNDLTSKECEVYSWPLELDNIVLQEAGESTKAEVGILSCINMFRQTLVQTNWYTFLAGLITVIGMEAKENRHTNTTPELSDANSDDLTEKEHGGKYGKALRSLECERCQPRSLKQLSRIAIYEGLHWKLVTCDRIGLPKPLVDCLQCII